MEQKLTDRQKTSIARKSLSVPVRTALTKGFLVSGNTVHDYGCGSLENMQKHGNDITRLQTLGYTVTGHDLNHGTKRQADIVFCSYVINVIENPMERIEVIKDAYSLCNKMLILSARVDKASLKDSKTTPYADGAITQNNTFQKFYTTSELQILVKEGLGKDSIKLGNGSIIIKKGE